MCIILIEVVDIYEFFMYATILCFHVIADSRVELFAQ